MSIPCLLQILDRGMGEVLKHCIDAVTRIIFAARHSLFTTGCVCSGYLCDRVFADVCCEDGFYALAGQRTKRLRLLCFARTCSTFQGRGYAVVALDFTGLFCDVAGTVWCGQ